MFSDKRLFYECGSKFFMNERVRKKLGHFLSKPAAITEEFLVLITTWVCSARLCRDFGFLPSNSCTNLM